MGFSCDDAEGKFLHHYTEKKILAENPFAVLDRKGVGKLMEMAVQQGRGIKPELLIGICGDTVESPLL